MHEAEMDKTRAQLGILGLRITEETHLIMPHVVSGRVSNQGTI